MFLRENNKKGYLQSVISATATSMTLQTIEYTSGADRNIPAVSGEVMRLVIWGSQFPNPGADPNREIVEATWSGVGDIYNIIRAQEGSLASEHYINDNVALLWTSDMSKEITIFEPILQHEDEDGTIATIDSSEIVPIQPDDEVYVDSYGTEYNKILVCGGAGVYPYWDFSWNVGGELPV